MPSNIPLENAARRHPMNSAYKSMLLRCYSPNDRQFSDYGGRGIVVCEQWLSNQENAKGFWNFVEDMGEKPTPQHSLDRKDNNGNYTPENCRWATRAEQQRNRRNNVIITYNDKTQCAQDWAKETGIKSLTIIRRFRKGLPLEVVFSKNNYQGKGF